MRCASLQAGAWDLGQVSVCGDARESAHFTWARLISKSLHPESRRNGPDRRSDAAGQFILESSRIVSHTAGELQVLTRMPPSDQ
jgi:hypothetical protein